MKLYRYRNIESALKEIENGAFHFASKEELNDPIESYVRLYFQGDKQAWEGLFKNYICSLFVCVVEYEEIYEFQSYDMPVDITRFNNSSFGSVLKDLSEEFLSDKQVEKFTDFYGARALKCSAQELNMVLRFIHRSALSFCIRRLMKEEIVQFDKVVSADVKFPFDAVEKMQHDELKTAIDVAEGFLFDQMECNAFAMKSRYENIFSGSPAMHECKHNMTWSENKN